MGGGVEVVLAACLAFLAGGGLRVPVGVLGQLEEMSRAVDVFLGCFQNATQMRQVTCDIGEKANNY